MMMDDVRWGDVGKVRLRHRGGIRPIRSMRPFGRYFTLICKIVLQFICKILFLKKRKKDDQEVVYYNIIIQH